MDDKERIDFSRNQLDRVLAFFPRVDSKASIVLGVDVGMLAILAANAPPLRAFDWRVLWAVVPVGLIMVSIWHLYYGAFPRLEGERRSLTYFRSIAERTEASFIEEFIAQKEDALLKDLLGQIWGNSEILKMKYDHLKWAFLMLAISILPWVAVLAMFAANNSESTRLLVK